MNKMTGGIGGTVVGVLMFLGLTFLVIILGKKAFRKR